jgi:hypothetical protein
VRRGEGAAVESIKGARMRLAPQPRLRYAPATPAHWLQRFGRRVIAAALAAILLLVGSRAGMRLVGPYLDQARVMADQRQVMEFQPPADTVALTNDSGDHEALLSGGNHIRVRAGSGTISWRYARDTPFLGYYPGVPPASPVAQNGAKFPTVFLHARRSPAGHTRLVHITSIVNIVGQPTDRSFAVELELHADLYSPATWRPGSTAVRVFTDGTAGTTRASSIRPVLTIGEDTKLRVRVGHPDPGNPARFIIPYECDGEAGEIAGLLTDLDTIYWERVTGPLHP